MARKKVKLAFIENESARKSTFKKRKRGILKKARELATLCDVKTCAIISSPYDSNQEMWPSREEVGRVVSEWQMLPGMDKTKKMVNQESFLQERISKATGAWKKLWKENRELEMKGVMFDCLNGKTLVSRIEKGDLQKGDLQDFGCVIEKYLKDLNHKIMNDQLVSATTAATTTYHVMPTTEVGCSSLGSYDKIRDQMEINFNAKQTNKDLDLDLNLKL